MPISKFFDGIEEDGICDYTDCYFAEPLADIDYSSAHKKINKNDKDTMLLKAFHKIKDRKKADRIYEYILKLAEDESAVFSEENDNDE